MPLQELNHITGETVDSAMEVHSELGPGLLESTYSTCLTHELRTRSLDVRKDVPVPIHYKGIHIRIGYKIDLLVANAVVVELKVVRALHPVHEAQLLSYLKLSGYRVGLLINFNVTHLRDGLKRMVNNY
ncbi:MAG TPA: GxxExxY protein [Gemmatimonadaceae bacterium]|nr:GxxExxY protein [Gemmatimonadaceae bacterium]